MSVNDVEVVQGDFNLNLLQEQATGLNLTGRYPIVGYGRAGEATISTGDVITADYLNGITSNLDELNGMFAWDTIAKSDSQAYDLSGPFHGILFTFGTGTNMRGGAYSIQRMTADTTTINITAINAATDVTISASGGVLTVANGNSTYELRIGLLIFKGTFTEHVEPEANEETR